jgi:hypothetical protein
MRPRFLQFPRPGQQLRLLRPFLRGQRLRVWRPSWIGQRLSFGDPPGTGNGSGSRGPFDPILKPECPVSASSSRCVSLSTKGYSEFGPGSGSGYGDPPGSVRGVRSGDPSGTRSGHGSCGPSDPSSGFSRIPSNSDTTWMETAHKPDYNALERWRSRTKASCVMMGPPAGISIRPQVLYQRARHTTSFVAVVRGLDCARRILQTTKGYPYPASLLVIRSPSPVATCAYWDEGYSAEVQE